MRLREAVKFIYENTPQDSPQRKDVDAMCKQIAELEARLAEIPVHDGGDWIEGGEGDRTTST